MIIDKIQASIISSSSAFSLSKIGSSTSSIGAIITNCGDRLIQNACILKLEEEHGIDKNISY
jgi:hypothetical protein